MKIAIITDSFLKRQSAASIQMTSLAHKFVEEGHRVFIFSPKNNGDDYYISKIDKRIILLSSPYFFNRDSSKEKRFASEVIWPIFTIFYFRKILKKRKFNGIIFYSPSIFTSLIAHHLKKISGCKSYMIVRDLFPDWLINLGIIKNLYLKKFFWKFEKFQYKIADVVGFQCVNDLNYKKSILKFAGTKSEVLQNWFPDIKVVENQKYNFDKYLTYKTNIIYAGNLGISQSNHNIRKLINASKNFDIGITFIGKGSIYEEEKRYCEKSDLQNIYFINPIDIEYLAPHFKKFDYGLFSLNDHHVSGHVPGKYVAYINYGLPVIGLINKRNELAHEIKKNKLGISVINDGNINISDLCSSISSEISRFSRKKIRQFANNKYSVDIAYKKIIGKIK